MSPNVHGEMWYYYTGENEKCLQRIPEGHSKDIRRTYAGHLQDAIKSDKVYTGNEKKLDQFLSYEKIHIKPHCSTHRIVVLLHWQY